MADLRSQHPLGTFEFPVSVVVKTLDGSPVSKKDYENFYSKHSHVEKQQLTIIIAGLLALLRAIFRIPESNMKPEALHSQLEELKLPTNVVNDIVEVAFSQSRKKINHSAIMERTRFSTLKQFQWRVDVSISTSSLSRVLEPTIVVKMTLSNGSIKHFEIPMKMFHKLRCGVATVLKEIEDLEKRSILKGLE